MRTVARFHPLNVKKSQKEYLNQYRVILQASWFNNFTKSFIWPSWVNQTWLTETEFASASSKSSKEINASVKSGLPDGRCTSSLQIQRNLWGISVAVCGIYIFQTTIRIRSRCIRHSSTQITRRSSRKQWTVNSGVLSRNFTGTSLGLCQAVQCVWVWKFIVQSQSPHTGCAVAAALSEKRQPFADSAEAPTIIFLELGPEHFGLWSLTHTQAVNIVNPYFRWLGPAIFCTT